MMRKKLNSRLRIKSQFAVLGSNVNDAPRIISIPATYFVFVCKQNLGSRNRIFSGIKAHTIRPKTLKIVFMEDVNNYFFKLNMILLRKIRLKVLFQIF